MVSNSVDCKTQLILWVKPQGFVLNIFRPIWFTKTKTSLFIFRKIHFIKKNLFLNDNLLKISQSVNG